MYLFSCCPKCRRVVFCLNRHVFIRALAFPPAVAVLAGCSRWPTNRIRVSGGDEHVEAADQASPRPETRQNAEDVDAEQTAEEPESVKGFNGQII